MFTDEQIKKLTVSRENKNLDRLGILKQYTKYEREINYKKLNPKQHFLFKRVLHGLKTL